MGRGMAGFHKRPEAHTRQSGLKDRKSPIAKGPAQPSIHCPECTSTRVWKDGLRKIAHQKRQDSVAKNVIQRWLCRDCGHRFSDPSRTSNISGKFESLDRLQTKILFRPSAIPLNRRVCETEAEGSKNLAEVESRKEKWAAGATEKLTEVEVKGKLLEFAWWMRKQGYADESIRGYVSCLRTLFTRGANLYDSESVKDVMARQSWSGNRRRNAINAYSLLLKMAGLQWVKPKCKVVRKLPFIPIEQELDALVAGCGKKTATFLQLLKEIGMRAGEAKRLFWADVDFENYVITLNFPEKSGNPRIWKVSAKLIGMLNALPRKSLRIFGEGPINSIKTTFQRARKRIATKLQNPRLLKISFHTFRHWKATLLYHETKNPLLVKEFLGHKKLDTTLLYIQVEQALFKEQNDEFTVMAVKTSDEIKALLEVGFEYICQKDELLFFRKRK
jgi:integrase